MKHPGDVVAREFLTVALAALAKASLFADDPSLKATVEATRVAVSDAVDLADDHDPRPA